MTAGPMPQGSAGAEVTALRLRAEKAERERDAARVALRLRVGACVDAVKVLERVKVALERAEDAL